MKAYTAFKFKDKEVKDFHCTHIYLGNISANSFNEVCKIISKFFADNPGIFPMNIFFDREEWFGDAENAVRVLIPAAGASQFKAFEQLRFDLEPFQNSGAVKYPFNPHVTNPRPGVELINALQNPIIGYVIRVEDRNGKKATFGEFGNA